MNIKDFEEMLRTYEEVRDKANRLFIDFNTLKVEHHDLQRSNERLVDEILSLRDICATLDKRIYELEQGDKKND